MIKKKTITKKHAQASLEFIILVGFVMTAFVIFFLVIRISLEDETSQRLNNGIKEIAWSIKNEVDLASESIDGYSRDFTLPQHVYGTSYTAFINESIVFVESDEGQHSISLALPEVFGTLLPDQNRIVKQNGIVFLNPPGP